MPALSVVATRGSLIESRHRVSAAVVDASGRGEDGFTQQVAVDLPHGVAGNLVDPGEARLWMFTGGLLEAGCVAGGACADSCPTGAIHDKPALPMPQQWTPVTACGSIVASVSLIRMPLLIGILEARATSTRARTPQAATTVPVSNLSWVLM